MQGSHISHTANTAHTAHTHPHGAGAPHHGALGHTHVPSGPGARARLTATLVLTAVIMVAEAVGGWLTGSLALLADAGHMLTDLLALVVALGALTIGARPADPRRTYGYRRLEVLAALLNSVMLVVVSITIVYEAVQRWLQPRPLAAVPMMAVAGVGLIANLLGLWLLSDARGNLNVRGAFLHILGDTLSSAGVMVGGGIILLTGWTRIDPLLSVGIAIIIVVGCVGLLKEVVDVLLEAVPRGIDTEHVRRTLGSVAGVGGVHDLHIWSITHGMPALSVHVVVKDADCDTRLLLGTIQAQLRQDYAIEHATVQIEHAVSAVCGCAQ